MRKLPLRNVPVSTQMSSAWAQGMLQWHLCHLAGVERADPPLGQRSQPWKPPVLLLWAGYTARPLSLVCNHGGGCFHLRNLGLSVLVRRLSTARARDPQPGKAVQTRRRKADNNDRAQQTPSSPILRTIKGRRGTALAMWAHANCG